MGGVTYDCDQCDYKVTTPHGLKAHKSAKHEGIRYTCNQCDYKATQKVNLKTHISTVHGKITFLCTLCNFIGKSKSYVFKHIKRLHKAEFGDIETNSALLDKLVKIDGIQKEELADEVCAELKLKTIEGGSGENFGAREIMGCQEVDTSASMEVKLDVVAVM